MGSKEENARAALKKLEDDPKHTKPTKETDEQTKNDKFDDPKFNDKDGKVDPKWHRDADGHYSNPDYE